MFFFELENTGDLLPSVLGFLIIGSVLAIFDFVLDLNESLKAMFVLLGQF
jgi:hypothetical protein